MSTNWESADVLETPMEICWQFDYEIDTSLFCRMMRALCYYVEDIECTDGCHDQAECTRDAFITRYLTRPHGCRDPRPEYQKRYL